MFNKSFIIKFENMDDKVSIIVPVYNGEKYLSNCLDSIINQTYRNFELFIINDGSTDKTFDIATRYKKLDRRINLINKVNEGVSVSRNIGISKSSGKYLCFVDADDFLEKNAIELLVNSMKKEKADLVIGSYNILRRKKVTKKNILIEDYMDKEKLINIIIENNILLATPWGKLFKTEIIKKNQIRFDEKMEIAEDTVFNLEYLDKISNISIISDVVYNYVLGGYASNLKYHKDINYSYYRLLGVYIKLSKDLNGVNLSKRKKMFLNLIIEHYCIFCSKNEAIKMICETFRLFYKISEINFKLHNVEIRNDNFDESQIVKLYNIYLSRHFVHILYRRIVRKLRLIIRF